MNDTTPYVILCLCVVILAIGVTGIVYGATRKVVFFLSRWDAVRSICGVTFLMVALFLFGQGATSNIFVSKAAVWLYLATFLLYNGVVSFTHNKSPFLAICVTLGRILISCLGPLCLLAVLRGPTRDKRDHADYTSWFIAVAIFVALLKLFKLLINTHKIQLIKERI
ncbi:MAG: hypothetical protein WCG06_02495 [Candidatus Omnitrophota bacterium]